MEETIRVCCAILMDTGKVLCAQRSASMSLPHKWEFPGGKIEPGEDLEDALHREIKEELGVEIEIQRKFQSNLHEYSEGKQIELIPFLGRVVRGDLQPIEHQKVEWIEVTQLRQLDFAEADIPIVDDLINQYIQGRLD